jgi:hypothetical protein
MISEFQTWRQLQLITQSQQQSFEEFASTMRDPTVVSNTHDLLQAVPSKYRHGLNARIFLSSLLLAQFPSETLSSDRNELEETLYQMSQQMVSMLQESELTLPKCDVVFHNYSACFQVWLKQDRESLVQLMAKVHRQIRSLDDSIPPDDTERVLSKIETVAESISGPEGVQQVRTASEYGLAEADIIATQLGQQMKRAFWDLLRRDLDSDPPDFSQYPGLVEDARKRIVSLLPRTNLETTSQYINSKLDTDRISQQIKDGTYTLQDIYNLLVFVLERVRELGPACEDEAVGKSIDHIHNEMKSEQTETVNLSELIPKVFQEALERLDTIGFTKDAFQAELRRQKNKKDNSKDKDPPSAPDQYSHMYS